MPEHDPTRAHHSLTTQHRRRHDARHTTTSSSRHQPAITAPNRWIEAKGDLAVSLVGDEVDE